MRILLAGMLAGDPKQGGATWSVLQYARGLERLGHEVLVVEPVKRLRPASVTYFESLGLFGGAMIVDGTHETAGLDYAQLADFDAELLLNISGLLRDSELVKPIPTRVFLDLDPVFVQLWHAQGVDVGFADHTHYVTVGRTLERSGVPLDRPWLRTVPPVVLDDWEFAGSLRTEAFTTVGHWRSYGSVHWRGRSYGQKAHAIRRLIDLPERCDHRLLPALAIHDDERADLIALREHGWELADPAQVAATPDAYRRFISGSKGELGLTKAGYVDSRCGWFSDRSACYLAAGRPVVAHDTGFADVLPTGEGLLAFSSSQEAADAIDRVCSDYDHHRRAARALAEEHLGSDRVLTDLLEAVL